jgi:hypothetical protein
VLILGVVFSFSASAPYFLAGIIKNFLQTEHRLKKLTEQNQLHVLFHCCLVQMQRDLQVRTEKWLTAVNYEILTSVYILFHSIEKHDTIPAMYSSTTTSLWSFPQALQNSYWLFPKPVLSGTRQENLSTTQEVSASSNCNSHTGNKNRAFNLLVSHKK